jgi:hypothetical protein
VDEEVLVIDVKHRGNIRKGETKSPATQPTNNETEPSTDTTDTVIGTVNPTTAGLPGSTAITDRPGEKTSGCHEGTPGAKEDRTSPELNQVAENPVLQRRLRKPPTTRKDDFFMDRHHQNETRSVIMGDDNKHLKGPQIVILHHNVQSLKNKLLELTVLLQSDLKHVDILCFTEHWLKEEHLGVTNIDHFKLVSKFSRIRKEGGGSCIFVKDRVQTKELDSMQGLCKEKDF